MGVRFFRLKLVFGNCNQFGVKLAGIRSKELRFCLGGKYFLQKMFSEENIFPCLVVVKRKWRWRWRWWGGSDGNSDGGGESDGSVVTLVRFSIENVVPLLTVENNFCPYRLFFWFNI